MVIGILSARDNRYHPNRRLMKAASKLGHKVLLIHPEKCLSEIFHGKLGLDRPVHGRVPVVLLPRLGATIKEYTLTLVRHFELMGIPVVNGFRSILLARNKFLSLQTLSRHGIPVPDSFFVSNLGHFEEAVKKLGGYPVVLKTPDSRQGKGVVLVESPMTAEFVLDNLPKKGRGLLVQEYMAPPERKDIRVLVLGERVIAAMELRPRHGDFRSNIHLEGRGRAVTLERELAELAIESTRALGLEISGTDIIVDNSGASKVLEVNYSPGFRGLEASTGIDIASQIIRFVART
jgi:ribosomal protein S6--L-glutamate ligase